jgi:hypothetical protein
MLVFNSTCFEQITTKVNIPLSNFDIAEFTGVDSGLPGGSAAGRQAGSLQTSPPCGASVEDTVYDLQGVVSHSGTLHGVSDDTAFSQCSSELYVHSVIFFVLRWSGSLHRLRVGPGVRRERRGE